MNRISLAAEWYLFVLLVNTYGSSNFNSQSFPKLISKDGFPKTGVSPPTAPLPIVSCSGLRLVVGLHFLVKYFTCSGVMLCIFLPPADGVAGRRCFYTCLSFCSWEEGVSLTETHRTGQRPPWTETPTPLWTETLPPYGNERAVRILLECILVFELKLYINRQ